MSFSLKYCLEFQGSKRKEMGQLDNRLIILLECQESEGKMPRFCVSAEISFSFNSPTFKGHVGGIAKPLLRVERASKKNGIRSPSVCMNVYISTDIKPTCILPPGGKCCHCKSGTQTTRSLSGFSDPCYGL